MIYFDNAATSTPYQEVVDTYVKLVSLLIGNPSSKNLKGLEASNYIEKARNQIKRNLLLPNDYEIIFTSGATESNNIAIQGVAEHYKNKGRHLITSKVEHPSVLNVFKYLEKRGFEVTYIGVDNNGQLDYEALKKSIRKDTILVSLMAVNNETGEIFDIKKIREIVKEPILMVDATQGVGKIDLDYSLIDVFSFSSHKIKGLKSIGCLIKRKRVQIDSPILGGGQEEGVRPGTLNAPLICSLATALRLYMNSYKERLANVTRINSYLREEFEKMEDQVIIASSPSASKFILNIILKNHKASVIVEALSKYDVYVSTKSACSEHVKDDSSVLIEEGYSSYLASQAIRISFEGYEKEEDAINFMKIFKKVLSEVKRNG